MKQIFLRTCVLIALISSSIAPAWADSNNNPVRKSSDKRYWDYGEVIFDAKTQLMWFKKDFWQLEGKHLNWYQAQEYLQKVNNKNYYGHSDWRLPTPAEAQSLYERRKRNTDKDGDKFFIDRIFPSGSGWSTWTTEEKGREAIVFSYKDEGWSGFEDKIEGPDAFLRPVRSGKP
tara:strand:- start:1478 stop:1999 length:522 start_codon:yes stop_codon:yes gene_type:complete